MSQRESQLAKLALALAVGWLAMQPADAAQVSSSMGVGITIDSSGVSQPRSNSRPLIVPAVVTRAVPATSYTWNAAALSVKAAGFKHARRLERSQSVYWFAATRKKMNFRVGVSVATGKVISVAAN